jgi:hypothetical protein
LGKLIVSQRFGMSAPKAENGFMRRRIVSSQALRRNNRVGKASNLNGVGFRRIGRIGRKKERRSAELGPDSPADPARAAVQ